MLSQELHQSVRAKSAARQGELGGEGRAAVKWDKPVDLQLIPI